MMRSLLILCTLVLAFSCKQKNKVANQLEIIDTQMAELKKEPPVYLSKKDSIKILTFCRQFIEAVNKHDSTTMKKLSLKNVEYPVYDARYNQYKGNKFASIDSFVTVYSNNNYDTAFSILLKTVAPYIYATYADSGSIAQFGLQQNKKIKTYGVSFFTRENRNNYIISRTHYFQLIKTGGTLKFAGLDIQENGSLRSYKLISFANLYFPLYRIQQSNAINDASMDTFSNKWYTCYLLDMKEPNIYKDGSGDEIYRFTWLRSFHNPVAIRFKKHLDTYTLYTKELLDYRGYIPQQIKFDATAEMTKNDWANFKDLLQECGFWNVVSNDPEPAPHDGAEWILEGTAKGSYHFIQRNMNLDKKFRACCMYLLSLTQLNISEKERY